MKLNQNDIKKFREKIEAKLSNLPDGTRIELPVDILEELIFLKIKINTGQVIKIPIWTGKFLQKLDLSQVSFEGAVFSSAICSRLKDKQFIENLSFQFSHTNIVLDFKKILGRELRNCDFSGVDLSKSHGEVLSRISCSNLSGTGIKVDFQNEGLDIYQSDLSKNSFSNEKVYAEDFNENGNFRFLNTNFSDTGLSVCLTDNANGRVAVSQMIQKGYLTGCFVNGKKIRSDEEKAAIKNQKREEYLVFKEQLAQLVDVAIDEKMERKLTPSKDSCLK